jgi:RNA polymerase sigma-70 factor (ECF subfamily)
MDSTQPDALMAYQQGDFAAATALVNRLSPQLHRFFLVQFVSRRHADDLLQETWLRIHEVRHTYRPGQPVLPWLYAIARNIRVDHYRKTQRAEIREQSLGEFRLPQTTAGAPPGLPIWHRLLLYRRASARIAMLKVSGMSSKRGAGHFVQRRSVKQKAHRAYERLRERLSGVGMRSLRKGGAS